MLTLTPSMSGTVQGSVTFTAPDGRYLWYTIELRTTPPEAECTLDVVAPLRKVVAVEIPILNPSDTPLDFEVSVQGVGLLGDNSISVPAGPDSQGMYELLFSPLVAGVSYGSIAFLNPVAGEFWYELKLVAEAAVPVALPLLQAPVGGNVTHSFTVSNPSGDELPLRVTCSNGRNFKIELAGGGPLLLPPYGEVEAVVTYTPSSLEQEQSATITLQHPKVGEWVYTATGVGHEPDAMKNTEVAAPLGQIASGTISFKNPFDEPIMLAVALERPADAPPTAQPAFQLLLRKVSGLMVAPGGTLMLPFTFRTDDI